MSRTGLSTSTCTTTVCEHCISTEYLELAGAYRFGFNGMERDDELYDEGSSYDFGARMLDVRSGRWMSIDPLFKKYVPISPFVFALNNPIIFKDIDGRVIVDGDGKKVTITFKVDGTIELSANASPDIKEVINTLWNESTEGRNTVKRMYFTKTLISIEVSENVGIGKQTDEKGIVKYGKLFAVTKGDGVLVDEKEGAFTEKGKVNKTATMTFFRGSVKTDEEIKEEGLNYEIVDFDDPNQPNQQFKAEEFNKTLEPPLYPDQQYKNETELFHYGGVHEAEHLRADNIKIKDPEEREKKPMEREANAKKTKFKK